MDVRASFYVPAVAALLHPDEQRQVVAAGHEIGIHGWIHELNSVLPYEAERDLVFRAADTLERITASVAVGMRTPSWDFSPNTLRIEKELGLLYDSSLMADEDCYELLVDGESRALLNFRSNGFVTMLCTSSCIVSSRCGPIRRPRRCSTSFGESLKVPMRQAAYSSSPCTPHVIGYRSRIWILEEIIRLARSYGDVWFGTHASVVRWARDNAL